MEDEDKPVEGYPDGLNDALRLAGCGLAVIPIPHGRKHPQLPQWQKAATTDAETVRSWWGGLYRGQGVGVAPRRMTDGRWLVVIDLDRHDPGADGCDTWADLCDAYGDAPPTVEATTGGGGTHLLFGVPFEVRNNAGTLGPGVDVRGVGGQIVVEPTVHPSGGSYAWVEGQEPWTHEIADAPGWLRAMLKPAEPDTSLRAPRAASVRTDRPGDEWAKTVTWDELLSRDGWTLHRRVADGSSLWTRPGKDVRDGPSASVGFGGSDVLKVFTTSMQGAGLEPEATYTKLGYFAAVHYGGDFRAAATALASEGFGASEALSLDALQGISDEPWEPPRYLPEPRPAPFPIEALPAWTVERVLSTSDYHQAPPDIAAIAIIGALSSALVGRARVKINKRWTDPVSLYLLTILDSGMGKSPNYKDMTEWLKVWERERIAAVEDAHRAGVDLIRLRQKQLNKAEGVLDPGDENYHKAYAALEKAKDDCPKLPRLLLDDVTPEATVTLLHQYDERLAIMSPEPNLIEMLLKGKSGTRANMDIFLKAHSQESMIVDRKGGSDSGPQTYRLDAPSLTISIAAQRITIDAALSDPEAVGRGLIPRFMPSAPHHGMGDREWEDPIDDDMDAINAFEAEGRRLATKWATWANPGLVRFSPGASSMVTLIKKKVEPLLRDGGEWQIMRAWWSKILASGLRYAAVLHLSEGNDCETDVTEETLLRAVKLMEYWADHAHMLLTRGASAPVEDQANVVLKWISEQNGTFTTSQLVAGVRSRAHGLNKVGDFVPALRMLEDLGWVRGAPDWEASIGVSGPKATSFQFSPVAEGFELAVRESRKSRTFSSPMSPAAGKSRKSRGFQSGDVSESGENRANRAVFRSEEQALSLSLSSFLAPPLRKARDLRDSPSTGAVDNFEGEPVDNSPTDPGGGDADLDWMTQ